LVLDAIRYPSPPAIAGSVLHGALKTLETLESVRDQPGEPGMGAQRPRHQIGARRIQPFLKQPVG
jgi:hypothetical protein